MKIRPPAVANMFYPGNAHMLKQTILDFLGKVGDADGAGENGAAVAVGQGSGGGSLSVPGILKGIVAPHAGYIYSGATAAYAYKLIKGLDQEKKWKVLLMGPSHHVPFAGAAAPIEVAYETPLGIVPVKDIRTELSQNFDNLILDIPDANKEEHSLEVQIPFLQVCLKDFVLYPLVLGSIRPDFLGEALLDFVKQDDVIVVASSDLSHYFPYEEAKKRDFVTSEAICAINIEEMAEKGDACGRMGILTLMYLAEKLNFKCKMLDYRNSGDTAGDKDRVVGYGAYAFYL